MQLNSTSNKKILQCLHYFGIFNHPLTSQEIVRYLSVPMSREVLEEHLSSLVHEQQIEQQGDYFGLEQIAKQVRDRKAKEELAQNIKSIAQKNAKIIAKLPYNLCVCISGSLSKGVMDEDGDIDYFIIAKPNRIWISKSILKLYKKIFLKNSKDHFCINYIITTDQLEIKEKNLFTATEIESMLLVHNEHIYKEFLLSNQWYKAYFPNSNTEDYNVWKLDETPKPYAWVGIFEKLLNNPLGDKLESYLQALASKRNKKKYAAKLTKEEYDLMFRSNKNEAKVHPPNSQGKVLKLYEDRLKTIQQH